MVKVTGECEVVSKHGKCHNIMDKASTFISAPWMLFSYQSEKV